MEKVLGEKGFEEVGEAVFGGGEDYLVGGGLDGVGGIAHGYAEARPLDHVYIVGAVSDGNNFFPTHTERRRQVAEGRALVSVRMPDFAQKVVGEHSGEGAVEVSVYHGWDAADVPGVPGDYDLGWKGLNTPGKVADRVRLDLQDFFVPAYGLGHFSDVEMVSHEDVGIQPSVFEDTNEPVGEMERNGGLPDNLVGDGVGSEGALVADYGERDAQGPAEGK